jgi:2-keto-3-deoxy-L-rhamnonate aldolase RhmA
MPDRRNNPFLDRLNRGELTLMMGIRNARTTEIVRIAQATGHHAIMVDLEHSAVPLDVTAEMCGTAHALGMTALVRIPENDYGIIGRLLDCGATGIVAPRIETAAQAAVIARACRFPPHGQRSQLAMVPQFGMRPMPARDLNPKLDEATIVQILIETPVGVENADAIAAVPGVDMIAIGANDLSAELGVAGDFAEPRITDCIAKVAAACKRQGKLLMLGGIGDLAIVRRLSKLGVAPLQLTGMDTDMLFSAAEQRCRRLIEWHAQSETERQ